MKKYLVLARCYNEPDNNTPSDEIWVQVVEFKDDHEKIKAEKIYTDEFYSDYPIGVDIIMIPIDEIEYEWEKAVEIW